MRPPLSSKAADFTNYTLSFNTSIQRGGSGFALAWPLAGVEAGIHVNIVGNYPNATTFTNTNRTLLPPNSIVLAYRYGLVNQTTLASYYLDVFKVPFIVQEDKWYQVSASLRGDNRLSVSLQGVQVLNVTLNNYYTGTTGSLTSGSFGFGGLQDQLSYIKDVTVKASNGSIIYQNPMTDAEVVLPKYGVQNNSRAVCLDGAKRDRLVWLGDFTHTSRIIGASTSRHDFVTGTLQTFVDWQLPSGQFPIDPAIGYPSNSTNVFASVGPAGEYYFLADYHILGLLAFTNYMKYSNDVAFANSTWSSWKLATSWLTSQVNSTTGLIDLAAEFLTFIGPTGGMAVNGASVQALKALAEVATAVGDSSSALEWLSLASNLTIEINAKLWSDSLGAYINSVDDTSDYSVAGISFAITSDAATSSRALSSIKALENLKLSPGYKDSTAVNSTGVVNISPNLNGFLLTALMESNHTSETRFLIENLWAAMLANETTNTGASWEYVNTDLQPGLSYFTSLSHPWGGAPTYVLTEYIAGIRPVTLGYKTWVIEPAYAGFGLSSASAQVQTPYGVLSVDWELVNNGKVLKVTIVAPAQTSGTFVLNQAYSNSTKANEVVSIRGGKKKTYLTYKL